MQQYLDMQLVHFALTVVFSFLIGLEIKTYRLQFHAQETANTIGSVRTYTFLGIVGYIFRIVDDGFALYIAGLAGFTLLFALFYFQQLKEKRTTILLYMTALVVYSFGPLIISYPLWLPSLLFVLTIFVLNAKQSLQSLTQHINAEELETLGKMVLLSAVILPLLPHDKVIPFLPLSPFEIWLAVVIISAISYGGYIVQKYFFRQKGYLLAGIVGGIYSSTATTVVLSHKAKVLGTMPVLTASIIAASSMMYLRLVIIAAVFNRPVAASLLLPFGAFFLVGAAIVLFHTRNRTSAGSDVQLIDNNPLELGTAFLFGGLFIAMMVLTQSVTAHFGTGGLNLLSFLVGFTDIDPFVLSILTGHEAIGDTQVVAAIMIAAGSNNILKAFYVLWFGGIKGGLHASVWLTLLGMATIASAFIV